MISELAFRDLVRDMPRIIGDVPPHLYKKHIVAAEYEYEWEIDPFEEKKTPLPAEVIKIFWKSSRGDILGESYDVNDPRLILFYKDLVLGYEDFPNFYGPDQKFVKVFNLIINAWIDYESESSVDLHSYYSECQFYFQSETIAVDNGGAQGSSEKQNINPESKIDPISCNSFRLTAGLGFHFNGQWYGLGPQNGTHELNEKQLRLIALLYESEDHRMNIKDVHAILKTEFKAVKFSSLSDLFRKSRKEPIKKIYGSLIKTHSSLVFLDIPQK